jgi:hypothetical protein
MARDRGGAGQIKPIAILALLLSALVSTASAADTLLTLTPRPGATRRVLVDRPAAPIGSMVLVAGGDGVLDIDQAGRSVAASGTTTWCARARPT